MRGLARKALILAPASLVGQWVDELTERFALTPVAADAQLVRRDEEFWTREPLVVASLPLARQAAHRDRLCRRPSACRPSMKESSAMRSLAA